MAIVKSIAVGTTFGRLTVLGVGEPNTDVRGKQCSTSVVRCECGNEKTLSNRHLNSGATTSCSCIRKEIHRTHGQSEIPEYGVWSTMIQRCTNQNDKKYASYGGRGISVCERWLKFENFIADMSQRPSVKHSLDRTDNDLGYSKENCCWATRTEQQNNTRRNVHMTIDGKTLTIAQWSRLSNVWCGVIRYRFNHGWAEKAAVWTPVGGNQCQ